VDYVTTAAKKVFGNENEYDTATKSGKFPSWASEDFSRYLQVIPGAFVFLGTGGKYGLHSNKFDFEDDVIECMSDFWL
jgi:metal-dependent amidase/aminoacylase/carboxypeptidase family protein